MQQKMQRLFLVFSIHFTMASLEKIRCRVPGSTKRSWRENKGTCWQFEKRFWSEQWPASKCLQLRDGQFLRRTLFHAGWRVNDYPNHAKAQTTVVLGNRV